MAFNSLNKNLLSDGGTLSIGPFGSLEVSQASPNSQATFANAINPQQWITNSLGTGASVTVSEGIVTCSSGISSTSRAVVQLNRGLKYRAGQGATCKMTAIFDPGLAGTRQLAGVGNTECGYYFSRRDTDFGIVHVESGRREIRKLTVTAAGGTEAVTVVLNGVSTTVNIVGGASTNQTSYQLSIGDYSQATPGWSAEAIDGTVYFTAQSSGPLTGTYSIAGTLASGTFSRVLEGVATSETFISQSNWNIDKFDGTGPSGVTLNPGKGNVYSIGYQYLGFGNAVFSIEDPNKGTLVPVHRLKYANSRDKVVLSNPYMAAQWAAENAGSTTSVSIKGASASQFIEGQIVKTIGIAHATSSIKSVTAALTPLVTIRANRVLNNDAVYGMLDPFNISIGHDTGNASGTSLLEVYVYENARLTGPTNYQYVNSLYSLAAADLASTGITILPTTVLKKVFVVGPNDSATLRISEENFSISNGDRLTLAAKTTSGTSTVLASLSWFEDQ
jgi:hypothetical protein